MGLGGGWNNAPVSNDDIKQGHEVIDTVLQANINYFDHADIYTFTKAEQVFGQVLNSRPELREQMIIQSKCGIRFEDENAPTRYDFSAQHITNSVEQILTRLNCEYLDVLLLHRPDPLMDINEVALCVEQLMHDGKINALGVSNMNHHQIALLNHALPKPVVINQLELSLNHLNWLDDGIVAGQSGLEQVNFSSGTMEYCQLNNIQIQAWGSLAQGIFSGRINENAEPHIHATASLVNQLAEQYHTSSEAIVLAFIQRHPSKIQPVIGTTNLDRINACAQAQHVELSREHWYQLYVSARGQNLP